MTARVCVDPTRGIVISHAGFDAITETNLANLAWDSSSPQLGVFFTGQVTVSANGNATVMFPIDLGYLPLVLTQGQMTSTTTDFGGGVLNIASNDSGLAWSTTYNQTMAGCCPVSIKSDRMIFYNYSRYESRLVRYIVFYTRNAA